jgi:hypothetical protein
MRVTRHSTRLSQPQGGAALAPLFNTPNSWAWTPGGLVSGAGLAQPTTVGAVNNYAITDGTARQVESLAAGIFIPPVARAQAGKIAFVFQFQLTSLDTASPNVIGFGNNGSVGSYVEQFTLNQDVGGGATAGKFRLSLRDAGGGRLDIGPTNVVFAIGGVYTVVVVATSGSTGRVWVNGVEIPVSYGSTGYVSSSALETKMFAIGNFNYGGSTTGYGDSNYGRDTGLAKFSLVARLEADALAASSLSGRPWQIFAPQSRQIWVGASAGGGGAVLASSNAASTASSAALSTSIPLASSASAITASTANLTAGGVSAVLVSSASATTSNTAALTTAIQVASSAAAATGSSSALTTAIRMQSTSSAQTGGAASLTAGQGMASASASTTASSAALSTSIALAAIASAQTSSAATLTALGQGLNASNTATTGSSASLTTSVALASGAAAATAATATLLTVIRLSSSVAATTAGSAALTAGTAPWAASNAALTIAAANLTTQILMAASGQAAPGGSATLSGVAFEFKNPHVMHDTFRPRFSREDRRLRYWHMPVQ